jgi:hypothetical protein
LLLRGTSRAYIVLLVNTANEAALTVAQTILSQLGGAGRLAMMCGCKNFLADENSVQFKVGSNAKKVTACRVVLEPSDTYTVEFYAGRGVNIRKVSECSDVYADSLRSMFESKTGMYLSF